MKRTRGREWDERPIRYARVMGLLFCLGGFVAIGLGWSGAASKDCVDCQVPFLLSGGAGGLGLIVFGGALLVMAQLRSDSRRIGARLEEVAAQLARSGERSQAAAADEEVVAGVSAYHRPACRLVAGKAGLEVLSVSQAGRRGLTPCRICGAPGGDAAAVPRPEPAASLEAAPAGGVDPTRAQPLEAEAEAASR